MFDFLAFLLHSIGRGIFPAKIGCLIYANLLNLSNMKKLSRNLCLLLSFLCIFSFDTFVATAEKPCAQSKKQTIAIFKDPATKLYGIKLGETVITPPKYSFYKFSENGMTLVVEKGLFGYIDSNGKEVIPPKYKDATIFQKGLAAVKLNGKWGYIDKTGREVIPLKLDFATPFKDGEAQVLLRGDDYIIDKQGKILNPRTKSTGKNPIAGFMLLELLEQELDKPSGK